MADSEPTIQLDVAEIIADTPEVEQVTTESEPSADETTEATEDQASEESDEKSDDSDDSEETNDDEGEEPDAAEDTEGTDQKTGKVDAETRKEQLSTEIRQLATQKAQLQQEVTALNSEFYKAQTAEELVEAGVDPAIARVEALEQQQQLREFNAHVTDLKTTLDMDSSQVMLDNPIFDEKSSQYVPELAQLARDTYNQVAGIQRDPKSGMIIQANVLPSQVYKAIADAHAAGSQNGKISGQKAAEQMLANSETPSSGAPTRVKEDPFLAGLTRGLEQS